MNTFNIILMITCRAVFIVIITGTDYMQTFDRLLQLNLQGIQEREIIRVIMVCAGRVRHNARLFMKF